MTALNEFLRRMLPPEHAISKPPDTERPAPTAEEPPAPIIGEEQPQPELSPEVAQEIVEGPSLAALVESNTPPPVIPAPISKLHTITDKALDKLTEILGMARAEVMALSPLEFERSIAWAKLQLNASEVSLRTQVRVDNNLLKKQAVDEWPKLRERLEKARIEARQLREARLAQDKGGVTGAGGLTG